LEEMFAICIDERPRDARREGHIEGDDLPADYKREEVTDNQSITEVSIR
jgi:hypothetical protein